MSGLEKRKPRHREFEAPARPAQHAQSQRGIRSGPHAGLSATPVPWGLGSCPLDSCLDATHESDAPRATP